MPFPRAPSRTRTLSNVARRPRFGASVIRRPNLTSKVAKTRRGGLINLQLEVVKAQFFDRKVLDRLDAGERRVLNKIGANIRSDARRSMRTRKGRASAKSPPSPAGTPPRSRKGQLKKFLFYWYDARAHDVIVGPIRLPRTRIAVPGVHEHGAVVHTQKHVMRYPARPYMVPALEKNRRKGLAMYRNVLHKR